MKTSDDLLGTPLLSINNTELFWPAKRLLYSACGKSLCTYKTSSSVERNIVSNTELKSYTLYRHCTSNAV
jgi:hypothetical protein